MVQLINFVPHYSLSNGGGDILVTIPTTMLWEISWLYLTGFVEAFRAGPNARRRLA
jgi:hypothetical protein